MKVWLLGSDPIFTRDLEWGFKQVGWTVEVSLPLTVDDYEKDLIAISPNLIMTYGTPSGYRNQAVLRHIGKRERQMDCAIIHWDTDGISWAKNYEMPMIEAMRPDITFTHCPDMASLLKSKHIATEMLFFAYNPEVHYKSDIESQYEHMITYVGNSYYNILQNKEHYRTKSIDLLLGSLMKNNIKIDLWGDSGVKALCNRWEVKNFDQSSYHGSFPYMETRRIYSNAFINLTPQNHPNYLTKRTYEIMASGGFVLTYDTPEIRRIFKPDKELVVAATEKEMIEKVHYYSEKKEEYMAIKNNAQKAIEGNSYKDRVEQILRIMNLNKG